MAKVYIVIEDTDESSIVVAVTKTEALADAAVEAIEKETDSDDVTAFYTEAELCDSIEELMQARDHVWAAYIAEMEALANEDGDDNDD